MNMEGNYKIAEVQQRENTYPVQTGTTKISLQRLSPKLDIYYVLRYVVYSMHQ